MNGCAPGLALIERLKATRKWAIEFTYSDFPCHLKVNRDKLASISCLWKSKTGERLTITANLFTKINQLDGFRPLWRSG